MPAQKINDNLYILSYDLADFLKELQDAFEQNYRLDYTKVDHYPFGTMGQYSVTLVPAQGKVGKEVQTVVEKIEVTPVETVEATTEVKKVGRKGKQ